MYRLCDVRNFAESRKDKSVSMGTDDRNGDMFITVSTAYVL
jgi:hypothetical protein